MMTFTELRRHIQELRSSGFNVVPFLVQLQRKVAFPFVTLVMTLLAVPFAVTTGRRGALYGVGLGIALALTYWLLTSVFGGNRHGRPAHAPAGRLGAQPRLRRGRRLPGADGENLTPDP